MPSLIYTTQKSKLSKKQRAKREELLKEQRAIKRSLAADSYKPLELSYRYPRETAVIASRGNGIGNAVASPQKTYTGDKIVGLATMHKSNCVPVFSDSEAKEISLMRR